MDAAYSFRSSDDGIDEAYRPLASLYFVMSSIWFVSTCSWTINTYKNRHFQINKLQWTLASVLSIKVLQLTLSFLFWHSCYYLQTCSLWLSFGVYITGVLFQTASVTTFLLISHGFCIMYERLSVTECRCICALGCVFYFILVGYKASVPFFSVLLLFVYLILFFVIFRYISQNLLVLRDQMNLIEDDDVIAMRDAVYTKHIMFKKFQGAMQIVVMAEIVSRITTDDSSENYWLRLLVREWVQFCVFAYIGRTLKWQNSTPHFSLMPDLKPKSNSIVPPIYSIEMDAVTYKEFSSHKWHIGVPTCGSQIDRSKDSILVIIQHPHVFRLSSANKPRTYQDPHPVSSASSSPVNL